MTPRLGRLPRPLRWLLTLLLASFALNLLFSCLLVREVTRETASSAEEYFSYKSAAALLRMAHQHSFGHGVMFFLTGGIFLMAGRGERLSLALVTGAFLGAWLDLASWFLIKYRSGAWEALSAASGLLFTTCFLAMAAISLYEMWRPASGQASGPGGGAC